LSSPSFWFLVVLYGMLYGICSRKHHRRILRAKSPGCKNKSLVQADSASSRRELKVPKVESA
jgi:hypothetical protein